MAKLFYFEGEEVKEKEVNPKNVRKGFQLKELYEMLECDLIEIGHISDTEIFVCDEEFRLKDGWRERWNKPANEYIIEACGMDFDLCGNILICKDSEIK